MALWAPVARSRGAALARRHLSSFHAAPPPPPPAFSARHAARHDTGRWASRARSLSTRASADERPPEEWDIAGLKAEARRAADRATKKVAKATTKLRQARDAAAALESKEDATLEELEKCPDVGTIEMELDQLRARYRDVTPTWRCVGNLVRSLHAERRHSSRRGTDFYDFSREIHFARSRFGLFAQCARRTRDRGEFHITLSHTFP